jgi:hypothetical protein
MKVDRRNEMKEYTPQELREIANQVEAMLDEYNVETESFLLNLMVPGVSFKVSQSNFSQDERPNHVVILVESEGNCVQLQYDYYHE